MTNAEKIIIRESFEKLTEVYNLKKFDHDSDIDNDITYLPFPYEEDITIDNDSLLVYLKEINSLVIHDNNRVTTDRITQRVIILSDMSVYLNIVGMNVELENNININIISEPFLIGLAALKGDHYSKFFPPCSSHLAIELIYNSKSDRLSYENEEKLIKSFFFDIAHSYKIGFEFGSFEYPNNFISTDSYLDIEENSLGLSDSYEEYNFGIDLFIKANQSQSPDIKFISYYKIFEYFSPFHSKITAFDAMQKKLHSSRANKIDANFISSIFELAKSYENSLRDKELIKSIIDKTFDLVDIYDSIPEKIRLKMLKVNEVTYDTSQVIIDKIINDLGNILYSTRNSLVHAKSNYKMTNLECSYEDLSQLNEFMHMACYSTIKWYNRLPEHLKIDN